MELMIMLVAMNLVTMVMLLIMNRHHNKESDKWAVDRKDLLNRIMAPDYRVYHAALIENRAIETLEADVPAVLTPAEIDAAHKETEEEERRVAQLHGYTPEVS